MPEAAAQNDMYQVRLIGRIDGQETNNVLHFRLASGAGDTDVELHLIIVLINCFVTHVMPVLTSGFTFEMVKWKRVAPTLGIEHITIPAGTTTGGGNAAALPSFCSALLSIRTGLGGRRHRGRMYIPGIPENQTTNSTINVADPLMLGLANFVACLVAAFIPGDPVGSNSWSMGVYSRTLGGSSFPYSNLGFTPITGIIPVAQVATTRSRKVGRGS